MEELQLPPQDIESEKAVLGAILIEPIAIDKVISILPKNAFYKTAHNKIYNAMLSLYSKGEPIDMLSVCDQLTKDNYLEMAGGAFFITGLADETPSASNVEHYAQIVADKFSRREIIATAGRMQSDAYDLTVPVDEVFDQFNKLNTRIESEDFTHFSVAIEEAKIQAYDAYRKGGQIGIPTGFADYDEMTAGFIRGELTLIAARPSMGKSAFMGQCALQIAEKGFVPAIVSIESSRTELSRRAFAQIAGMNTMGMKRGKLNEHQLKRIDEVSGEISKLPIYIDDNGSQSIQRLKAKVRKLKSIHGVDVLFVDYLQLMSGSKQEKMVHQIGDYSAGLKSIAKELDIAVAALVQLNRNPDQRSGNGHRPIMSDLRDSGNLEQDADVIAFLYRPIRYDIKTDPKTNRDVSRTCEFIIGKHRDGPTGTVYFTFEEEYVRFKPQDPFDQEEPTDLYRGDTPW